NFFDGNDTCKKSVETSTFLHFSLIPSVVIILILASLEKRTKRFWFDDRYLKCPRLFWILLMAFEVGIASYPFFVCLLTKYEVVGAVLGFLYTAAWTVATIFDILDCSRNDNLFGKYTDVILKWPSLLFLFLLLGRFLFNFVKAVRFSSVQNQNDKDSLMEEYQLRYVQQLLRKPVLGNPEKNWFQRKLYQWDPYFKFPSRLISTIVVMFLCLYMFIGLEFFLIKSLITGLKLLHAFLKEVSSASGHGSRAFGLLLLKQIKLLRAGKRYLLVSESMKVSSSQSVVALSKFISFQIAYIMWGYLIMHLVQWLFGMMFMYILILPMIHGKWMDLLNKWGAVILTFIIVIVVKKIQVFVGGKFFLQPKMSPSDSQKPLALDNRRIFVNFSYFLFFHSVVVGLTSCMMRLFRSIIIGVWLVGRIDRPVMPKGYEQCDVGYTVWIGMLFLDHYHTNPILVCFCQILCDKLKQKKLSADSYSFVYKPLEVVPRVSSKARTRWFLLYTLLNNPSIQKIRKLKPLSYSMD
ncbi:hypothetical protein L345_12434, partial [Ophiophagus hannah]